MKLYALFLIIIHIPAPQAKGSINLHTGALPRISNPQPNNYSAIKQSNHETIEPSSHHPSITESQYQNIPSDHRIIRSSNNQPDTLPPPPVLNQSIDSFYAQQTHLQLLEFRESKKGEWLKFLPNLGITYTVTGQPRPSISLSSGLLYQAQREKHTRDAKRRQIIENNRLEAEREKSKLRELLLRYQLLQEELEHLRTLHRVEAQLFAIREDEYQRQERAPSDFLQAKRTFLLQEQVLRDKEGQLQIIEMEIWVLAHL